MLLSKYKDFTFETVLSTDRNLAQLVRIADHTRVIDNSDDKPYLICEVLNQHVTIWKNKQWNKKAILRLLADNSEA